MVQIKCLSNSLYSLKNSHILFGMGFQPPPYGRIPFEQHFCYTGSSLTHFGAYHCPPDCHFNIWDTNYKSDKFWQALPSDNWEPEFTTNLFFLTIKCDNGQHLQFLQQFVFENEIEKLRMRAKTRFACLFSLCFFVFCLKGLMSQKSLFVSKF